MERKLLDYHHIKTVHSITDKSEEIVFDAFLNDWVGIK